MREYETIFVIRPDGAEPQTNQLLERIGKTIERHGGTVFQQKNWGKRELAYRVKKYKQGVYYYYDYSGDSGLVTDLEHTLKLNDLSMKYLTVKIADTVDIEARKNALSEAEKKAAETVDQKVSEILDRKVAETTENEEVKNA